MYICVCVYICCISWNSDACCHVIVSHTSVSSYTYYKYYIYMCVCVCVCVCIISILYVCESERQLEAPRGVNNDDLLALQGSGFRV